MTPKRTPKTGNIVAVPRHGRFEYAQVVGSVMKGDRYCILFDHKGHFALEFPYNCYLPGEVYRGLTATFIPLSEELALEKKAQIEGRARKQDVKARIREIRAARPDPEGAAPGRGRLEPTDIPLTTTTKLGHLTGHMTRYLDLRLSAHFRALGQDSAYRRSVKRVQKRYPRRFEAYLHTHVRRESLETAALHMKIKPATVARLTRLFFDALTEGDDDVRPGRPTPPLRPECGDSELSEAAQPGSGG